MLMVLNLHSFSGYNHGDGLMQALDFYRESTSICAVDTFILISGYFGIKWRMKGLFNLLFQVLFYSFAVYGVCIATGILQFEKGELLNCFKAFRGGWGFISRYIVLYFVSPWLNAYSDNVDKKQLLLFIIIFWIAEIILMKTSGTLNFCLIYLIGRWLAKEGTEKYSAKAGWGYVISTLIIFICSYAAYRMFHFDAAKMGDFVFGYSYTSPFVIMQAVCLFLVFSRLKLQSNTINWLAASCLSIFLIHMHPAIKQIGYYSFTESLYNLPFWQHTGVLVFLMLVVFFGSVLIDKLRIFISDNTYKVGENLIECIKKQHSS